MDKTPRTDLEAFDRSQDGDQIIHAKYSDGDLVNASFARQLETELSSANAQLAEVRFYHTRLQSRGYDRDCSCFTWNS